VVATGETTDLSLSQVSPLNALSIGDAAGPRRRPHFLARRRYQLLGAFVIAVVVPLLLRPGFDPSPQTLSNMDGTAAGTLAAMLFGAYLLRRMTAFPGVSTVAMLIPALGAAYAAAALLFFLARFDYSRAQFLVSFIGAMLWFGFVSLVEHRARRPPLLLVPFGKAENLLASTQADWTIARGPTELPAGVGGVVVDLHAELAPEWEKLLAHAALEGLPVYHWKQVAESLSGMVDIERLSENNLGSLLPSSIYLRFKRLFDVMAAIVVLPVVLPIIGLAALAIRLTDGAPVLFHQKRMGFRGRPFTMLKLRTMRVGDLPGPAFTKADDPRITPFGRFLRQHRIDELPQIVNILRGEMSWVGPRPESLELAEWYQSKVAFYEYRHILRPGISGWAQVNQGNVANVEAATNKLRYDFYYIKYFSPWLDVLIVARTIRTILTGFGSR
jgi:lipopolysaccharide/colanic/teichoic acid biosynthesis glycosyltransferase